MKRHRGNPPLPSVQCPRADVHVPHVWVTGDEDNEMRCPGLDRDEAAARMVFGASDQSPKTPPSAQVEAALKIQKLEEYSSAQLDRLDDYLHRLQEVEKRLDEHARCIADLMLRGDQSERGVLLPAVYAEAHPLRASLEAIAAWTHPESWTLSGLPDERQRTRAVLSEIHAKVTAALAGEEVSPP